MKNVPAPIGDYFSDFQALVARKRTILEKSTLQAIEPQIQQRYNEYIDNCSCPENVISIARTVGQQAALKSCYKNSAKFKKDLLGEEYDEDKVTPRCPYCQVDPARTWDHFLPSSKHPDYYVFPLNLIRTCHPCNESKGNRRVSPERKTIHPYFDRLSEMPYLKCTIQIEPVIMPNYSIDPDIANPRYDNYTEEIASRHFVAYGLARKFRAEASRKLVEFKNTVQDWKLLTQELPSEEAIAGIIDNKVNMLVVRGEGPNHWEIALWQGIKEVPDLHQIIQDWFQGAN